MMVLVQRDEHPQSLAWLNRRARQAAILIGRCPRPSGPVAAGTASTGGGSMAGARDPRRFRSRSLRLLMWRGFLVTAVFNEPYVVRGEI
jgi:hypothetical protein